MSYSVRPCEITDLPALIAISRQTFSEAYWDGNDPANMLLYMDGHFHPDKMTQELQNPHTQFYFLLNEQLDVEGYLKVNFGPAQTEMQDAETLEIERIYLKKVLWGGGVGQLLMDKAVEVAMDNGLKYTWLGVWKANERAIRFYQKMGFEIFGTHIFQLGDDAQEDWLMRRKV